MGRAFSHSDRTPRIGHLCHQPRLQAHNHEIRTASDSWMDRHRDGLRRLHLDDARSDRGDGVLRGLCHRGGLERRQHVRVHPAVRDVRDTGRLSAQSALLRRDRSHIVPPGLHIRRVRAPAQVPLRNVYLRHIPDIRRHQDNGKQGGRRVRQQDCHSAIQALERLSGSGRGQVLHPQGWRALGHAAVAVRHRDRVHRPGIRHRLDTCGLRNNDQQIRSLLVQHIRGTGTQVALLRHKGIADAP